MTREQIDIVNIRKDCEDAVNALDKIAKEGSKNYAAILLAILEDATLIDALKAETKRADEAETKLNAYCKYGLEPCDYAVMRSYCDDSKNAREDLKNSIKEISNMLSDRDHWKARAETLKQDINDHQPCWACKKDMTCEFSNSNGCSVCGFEFDEARFAGG